MNLYSKNSLKPTSKLALAGAALVATLFVSGCDKKEASTDTAAPADTTTETTTEVASEATTTDAATTEATPEPATDTNVDTTLAQLSSDTLNNMVFVPLINSGQLTDEQKTCLEARDKNFGLAESQAYFESKLTKEELDELNAFYSSDIGKKLIAYGNEQLQMINGTGVDNPMPAPSEEEMAQMQEFMQSPVGQKYMELNNAEGEGSMYDTLNPIIEAEFKRCNIDINQ